MFKERPIAERLRINLRDKAVAAVVPLALLTPAATIHNENPSEQKPAAVSILSAEYKSGQDKTKIHDLVTFGKKSDAIIYEKINGKGHDNHSKNRETLAQGQEKVQVKIVEKKTEEKKIKNEVQKYVKKTVELPHLSSVPLFRQADRRWGNMWFGTANMADSGCGPTSLAMVVSYYENKIIKPPEVAKKIMDHHLRIPHVGTNQKAIIEIPKLYGLDSHKVSWDQAKKDLHKGKPIIQVHGPGYFTSGGHYVVLTHAEGNKYYVNDSGPRHRTVATEREIKNSLQGSWEITPKSK